MRTEENIHTLEWADEIICYYDYVALLLICYRVDIVRLNGTEMRSMF